MGKRTACIKKEAIPKFLDTLELSAKDVETLSTRTDMLRKFEEEYPGYLEQELDIEPSLYSNDRKDVVLDADNIKTKLHRNTLKALREGGNAEHHRVAMLKIIIENHLNQKITDDEFIDCSNPPVVKGKSEGDININVNNGVAYNIKENNGTISQTLNFGSSK